MLKTDLNLSRKNKLYFAVNKNLAIAILVFSLSLLVGCIITSAANSYNSDKIHSTVFLNFLLVIIIITLSAVYKIENLTKDHALKIINKISQLKLSVLDINDLINLICKNLEEELGGRFWLIFEEKNQNLDIDKDYRKKALKVLRHMIPLSMNHFDKIIYFQPLFKDGKKIAVLVAEVNSRHDFNFALRKILSDQIAIIITNFKMRVKLQESNINQEREKLRSLILSSISHDLKTPLSSIIGSLSIFNNLSSKKKLDAESKKTLITTALEEAERLNGFISEVLEMTRIESGAIRLHKQLLDPSVMVRRILKRFEEQLKGYRLKITLNEKIQINFDQTSYEQVMQNLVENTLKYAPKNTKISIWDELCDDTYYISIKDEGGGIEPEKLHLIFNKFERFSLEDKVVGSGLGLSIVKALMDINNASIIAKNSQEENESERGAIFVLGFKDFIKN